jgi:hypothetical protein
MLTTSKNIPRRMMSRKRIDWLSVGIFAMLVGGSILFVAGMRLAFG